MVIITKNYGLAGGELDCTEHLVLAVPRMLDGLERIPYMHQLAIAATHKKERECAGDN